MCVIPKSMSSTTLARWYVGEPSSRQSITPPNRCGNSAATSRWRATRSLARTGPSSPSTPSHWRSPRISSSPPGTFRAGSVSAIRSSIQSPSARFATALRAFPTCKEPVGLGAKRTRFIGRQSRRRKPLRQTPADPPDGERKQRDGEPRVQTALDALEEPEPMRGLDDVHVEEPVGSHATVERSRRGMRIRRTGRGDVERRDQTTEAVVSPLAEHPGAGMRHIRAGYGNVFHRHGRDKVATYEAGYDEPEPHEADERHRHRRHGSPEDGSRGNSERDRKQRIGDRYDA